MIEFRVFLQIYTNLDFKNLKIKKKVINEQIQKIDVIL